MFIKRYDKEDDYINMYQVESLTKGTTSSGKSTINFGMVSGLRQIWSFRSREERDKEYQKVLDACGGVKPIQGVLNEG